MLFTAALLVLAFEGTYSTPYVMIESMRHRVTSGERVNLVPFRTISSFFHHFMQDVFLVNIVGNIVMFMPWGFGLVLLWKKNQSVGRVLFLCFLITALIETGQLFIGRSVDVDDLILNFAGGCAERGRRIRKYVVLVPIFILLCFYHRIGKRIEVEWEEEPV